MKQDKFEKFVSENLKEFDELEPSMQIWEQIDKNIQPKKPNLFLKISWQVAAAIAIFIVSYFFHDYVQDDKVYYATTVKQINNVSINTRQVIQQKTLKKEIQSKNSIITNINKDKQPANNKTIEKNAYSELNELSSYYTLKINKEKNDIFVLASNNPEVKTEINNEFDQLDKAYKELQKDLKENIDNNLVIDAMIQNYRMKLEVLEYMKNHLSTVDIK